MGAANGNVNSIIKDIGQWLIANFMCRNDSKTDISILCSMHRISVSNSLTNLGVLFDHHIKMDKQISVIIRSSFCSLRDVHIA